MPNDLSTKFADQSSDVILYKAVSSLRRRETITAGARAILADRVVSVYSDGVERDAGWPGAVPRFMLTRLNSRHAIFQWR